MRAIEATLVELHDATAELIAAARAGDHDRFAALTDRRGRAVSDVVDAARSADAPLLDTLRMRLAPLDQQADEASAVLSAFADRARGALRELGRGRAAVQVYAGEASPSRALDQSV
jgi:hypothetical protein